MTMTSDEAFELKSAIQLMTAALKDATAGGNSNTTKAEADIKAAEAARKQAAANTNLTTSTNGVTSSFKKLGVELLKIADAGVKFGSMIGTTATKGVEIEIRNRAAVAAQLFNFNANLAVTVEQLKAAQTGFSDVFIGAAEGMQISAKGSLDVVKSLKEGFNSEFQPTAETFRILTQMGMSTTEQFDAFRRATGRASLSNTQLTTLYNKNSLSFLLYGNSFARAAVQAEKLGVNLASIQSAQESLVTNLDGTIDTVAQINQLGGNIDFGSLVRIAEQDGPAALMAYVKATVPANMMQSASTRALFRQLGISVEDYLKSGDQQVSAAQSWEQQMTEAATKTGTATTAITGLGSAASKIKSIVTESFGSLAIAAYAAAAALLKVAASGNANSAASLFSTGGFAKIGTGAAIGTGLAGLATGIGAGTALGGTGLGSTIGSIAGGALGAFLGPAGMFIGSSLGGIVGGQIGKAMKSDDMFSAGYGSRTLITPSGAYALNNADDIIAGTKLFPKGALSAGGDNSELIKKIDTLINALSSANTTINVGGTTQTVPRIQLVGVYSRNEVR